MKIILASQSPRRKEILTQAGFQFEVVVSDADENIKETNPEEMVKELSKIKAMAVADELDDDNQDYLIIGSDTVVAIDNEILGKPKDKDEARIMIGKLSGRTHEVYTGVTVYKKTVEAPCIDTFAECTKVHVAKLSDEEIEAYISTDEPYDKAGGYGIQGGFAKHIEKIDGDYYNVMGLPMHRVYSLIKSII